MFAKLKLFWEVLQRGKALANREVWADRATRTGTIVALISALSALAFGFGYDLNLSVTDINDIAAGISALVAVLSTASNLLHVASNTKAHIPAVTRHVENKARAKAKSEARAVEDLGLDDADLLARTIWGVYGDDPEKLRAMAMCLLGYEDMRKACLDFDCWKPGNERRLAVLLADPEKDATFAEAVRIATEELERK